ncbi:MAG: LptF/LptG family permease, partial [Candidatus Aminicenantes bacterium]|nr:LptF/LptG family permease [Candidatus Aminicenantes bacterium]
SAFNQLSVYDFDSSAWTVRRRVYSERAYLRDGQLDLEECWSRDFSGGKMTGYGKQKQMALPIQEDKSYFLKEWKEPDQMSYGELRKYVRELEERNFDTVRFRVDLDYKISFPFICLIMTIIGIPFAFSLGRRGTLVGIGLSILIAMVYWGAVAIFQGMGYVNYLNSFLSAWGPNLIFGLTGLYLLFTLRT